MNLKKHMISVLLTLALLIAWFPAQARATGDSPETCAQNLLNYYRCYGQGAAGEVEKLLQELEKVDPLQGLAWRKIITSWRWVNENLELNYGALPQDLPEDDSFAIVIMGFGLNPNGTMRPELYERLAVGLTCARQYPNAYVIVTGGPTSIDTCSTEAGMMKLWLLEQGIPVDRIISEPRSFSTAENALNVYKILNDRYPEIQSLAIVTSDYHIARSWMDFAAVSHYYSTLEGTRAVDVVAHACCDPGYERSEEVNSQAADIAAIVGLEMEYRRSTGLYSGKP